MTSLKTLVIQVSRTFWVIIYFDFLAIYFNCPAILWNYMKHYILQWLIFYHFWKIRYSWNKVIEGKSRKNYITIALLSPTCTSCIFVWNLMFWWSVMGGQEDQKTDNQKIERHRTNDKHFMLCNTHALLRISFVSFLGVFWGGWVRECLSWPVGLSWCPLRRYLETSDKLQYCRNSQFWGECYTTVLVCPPEIEKSKSPQNDTKMLTYVPKTRKAILNKMESTCYIEDADLI